MLKYIYTYKTYKYIIYKFNVLIHVLKLKNGYILDPKNLASEAFIRD